MSESSHQQPDTLYEYDAFGDLCTTAIDVDGDGQISCSGPDHITTTATRYEQDASNVWWRVTALELSGGSVQPAIQKTIAGRTVSVVSFTAVTNAYTFDGFGRKLSAVTSVSTNVFTYYGLCLVSELQNTSSLDRKYDSLGRPCIFYINGVGQIGAGWLDTFDYIVYTPYNGLGLIDQVCGGISYANYTMHNYDYLPGSDKLQNTDSFNSSNYAVPIGWN